jgi:hypothetical protein
LAISVSGKNFDNFYSPDSGCQTPSVTLQS